MFVILQIIIALFTLTRADPFCERHRWGTYCTDDLTGYIKCSGSIREGFKVLHSETCPTNTRCSCFAGNDCQGYLQIDDADICQAYEVIHPVKETLFLRYKLNGWREGDNYDDTVERYKEWGEIKQDLRAKSVMYKTKRDDGKEKFELIIPDDKGTFTKYSGGYQPNVCEKSTVNNLKLVGDGIKDYTLKEREVISEGFEKQVLESNVYSLEGSGLSNTWTVFAHDKRITPLYYSYRYVGTQEEQCCGYGEKIRYYRVPYDESAGTDQWFKVPYFCP